MNRGERLADTLGVAVRTEPDPLVLTARIKGNTADQGVNEAVARAIIQLARTGRLRVLGRLRVW
jgi:hypothetical protein